MPPKIEIPDLGDAIRRYESGETAKDLADEFGVSDKVFMRWLRSSGVEPRTMSEIALIRDRRMPAEARKSRALAAQMKRRGQRNTPKMGERRAATVERLARFGTKGEAELAFYLAKRGHTPVVQKAIGIYNVDLALEESRVAVEVNGVIHVSPYYADRRADPLVRLEYILDAGWSVIEVFVHPHRNRLREIAAEHVIAFMDLVRTDEAPRGQHRVITGNGEPLP